MFDFQTPTITFTVCDDDDDVLEHPGMPDFSKILTKIYNFESKQLWPNLSNLMSTFRLARKGQSVTNTTKL